MKKQLNDLSHLFALAVTSIVLSFALTHSCSVCEPNCDGIFRFFFLYGVFSVYNEATAHNCRSPTEMYVTNF